MKVINVKEDYGITDLDDESKIIEFVDKLEINQTNEIELNFFDVIIAYPGASKIIDKTFELVQEANVCKKITIKTDFYQNEEELFTAIFWGSRFFDIEVYSHRKPDEIKKIIKKKLQQFDVSLSIEIYDQKNKRKENYEL